MIENILLPESEVLRGVRYLAREIKRDYMDKDLVLVCVLKGSVLFYSDLCKQLDMDFTMHFMWAKSYQGTVSSDLSITCPDIDVKNKDVLIVEDIVDTGKTLKEIKEHFTNLGAKSVKCVSFLYKPDKNITGVIPDYYGYAINDVFVIGYGMDYNEHYRNLRYVGVISKTIHC